MSETIFHARRSKEKEENKDSDDGNPTDTFRILHDIYIYYLMRTD